MNTKMKYKYNDGGRSEAGYKGRTGDCGARALAIATDTNYTEIYNLIIESAKSEKITKARPTRSHPRTGVWRDTMHQILTDMGWHWVAKMKVGQGCTTHLSSDELPEGRIIVRLSKHYAAVIDGVLHDTHDCSRNGTRCVYGYWTLKPEA